MNKSYIQTKKKLHIYSYNFSTTTKKHDSGKRIFERNNMWNHIMDCLQNYVPYSKIKIQIQFYNIVKKKQNNILKQKP